MIIFMLQVVSALDFSTEESIAESTTTSTSWQNKLTYAYTPDEVGEKLIIFTASYHADSTTDWSLVRGTIGGTAIGDIMVVAHDNGANDDYQVFSEAVIHNFTSLSSVDLEIDYESEAGTLSRIKDARITVLNPEDYFYQEGFIFTNNDHNFNS